MTCSNWMLTLFAVVILVFDLWQTSASKWLIAVAAVLVLIVSWTGVNCNYCPSDSAKPMSAKPATKKKKK